MDPMLQTLDGSTEKVDVVRFIYIIAKDTGLDRGDVLQHLLRKS